MGGERVGTGRTRGVREGKDGEDPRGEERVGTGRTRGWREGRDGEQPRVSVV